MFLKKKEFEFFNLLNRHGSESIYKLARPIFSVVTINKRIQELKRLNLIKVEMIGRTNEIKFTDNGKEMLKNLNRVKEMLLL